MILNAAIDTGYGYGMLTTLDKEISIPNYITRVDKSEAEEIRKTILKHDEKNILLRYGTEYYAVGELAQKINTNISRYLTSNRIGDTYHLIELIALLGFASSKPSEFNVNLGVSLPNKLRKEAAEFKNWLLQLENLQFSYLLKDKEIVRSISISTVSHVGQAIAPILNLSPEDRRKIILSIDIGHNTTDLCFWSDGVINSKRVDSEGVKQCYGLLEDKITSSFRTQPHKINRVYEQQLATAIEKNQFIHNREALSIDKLLKETFNQYAEYLYKETITNYQDLLPTADIILVSGGIVQNNTFLKSFAMQFKDEGIEMNIPEQPQWSVVRGVYQALVETFGEEPTEE